MAEQIIKYNKPKESKRSGSVYISNGAIYRDSINGTSGSTIADSFWKRSQGNGSLVPADSKNLAKGVNSVAIGTSTLTTNEGELAIGQFNNSVEGYTLFSVGDGESESLRHNVFEVNTTGFCSTNGTIQGKLSTDQLEAISGYIQTLLADEITTDYLTVTKAAHFFKLIIDEIKASQGAVIITPANAILDKVENISGGWRCYYRANDDDGKQIYNCFEVNDQVVCQTFDASTGVSYDVSNTYYWRKVIATGSTTTDISGTTRDVHYFDLSETDCDKRSMTPKAGDNCVQLGNRTDTTRQAAIVISAYNSEFLDKGLKAPSICQYAGINDYNLSNHRLNVISNGLNVFKGSYNNNSGKNIETIISETATTLDGKITTLNGVVTSHTKSISELKQTDNEIKGTVSSHTQSIGTLNSNVGNLSATVNTNTTNISTLQQTATALTSTVSSHSTSISTLNNDVGTIKSDYVTSSKLNQTATSITANITDALGDTGIDITSNNITLKAGHTTLENVASDSATWLQGNVNGSCKFLLGINSYKPVIKLGDNACSTWQTTYLSTDTIHIRPSSADYFITAQVVGNEPSIFLRRGNSKFNIYINSSGKIIFEPSSTSVWPTEGVDNIDALPSGAIYLRSDSCLGIKR